jgi:hypothetical protein
VIGNPAEAGFFYNITGLKPVHEKAKTLVFSTGFSVRKDGKTHRFGVLE